MEGREERVIVRGDFNAKTGEEGGEIKGQGEEEEEGKRKSKDKKMNAEGRRLLKVIEKLG